MGFYGGKGRGASSISASPKTGNMNTNRVPTKQYEHLFCQDWCILALILLGRLLGVSSRVRLPFCDPRVHVVGRISTNIIGWKHFFYRLEAMYSRVPVSPTYTLTEYTDANAEETRLNASGTRNCVLGGADNGSGSGSETRIPLGT
jgi:hypothetical protein